MSIKTQPMTPATTQTTRLLWPMVATRTARLRAALRRIDPTELAILVGVLAIILVVMVQSRPASVGQPLAPPAPIIVFRDRVVERQITATPAPAQPAEIPAVLAAPAPVEPTPAPVAPDEQPAIDLQVLRASEPTVAPAPTASAQWDDDTLIINGPSVPPIPPANIGKVDSQGWRCGDTYGDWRDTNPMYAHPECYK